MSTNQDVADLLDIVFANDGHEPDWSAVWTKITTLEPVDSALAFQGVLQAVYAVYEEEDTSAQMTLLWSLTNPDEV